MSGQSSHLSISEARAMQCKIQAKGSHSETNGGSRKSSGPKVSKVKHTEQK